MATPIKINVESAALISALNVAAKVAVAQDGSVTLAGESGKLVLHSVGDLSRCSLVIPAEVVGKDFEFAIPLDALRDSISGRASLDMSWDGTTLTVKSPSYKADLLTLDPISRDEVDKIDAQEWKVSPEQGQWLKGALNAVGLKPTALLSSFIPVSVRLTAKGAFVACYDNQHMAFLNSKEAQGELELTLPLDTFSTILDVLNGQAFRMRVSSSRVELKSKLASIILSLPAMDDSISISDVMGKAKEVAAASGTALKFSKAEMLAFMTNAKAVIGKERAEVQAEAKDGKLKFTIQTVRGTSSAILKSEVGKAINFKVDYEYLLELAMKVREDQLELSVVGTAFMSAKSNSTHLLVALNQS